MKKELIITEDGSHTLYLPEINEHYHSTKGAIQESLHIYINSGLRFCNKQTINILEIGFGTGLNALLTYYESEIQKKNIFYYAIELFPVDNELVRKLNYAVLLNKSNNIFYKIHDSEWNMPIMISEHFSLFKENADILSAKINSKFDIVYFDAFAPDKQAEVWNISILKNIYNAMNINGILVTYSVKGDVKRALKRVGFNIELLPGPVGKRHILRAIKNNNI